MEVIRAIAMARRVCDAARSAGRTVGFIPTMGAFHDGLRVVTAGLKADGHASLMRRARDERDHMVVSIFVNPLQFGPGEDLSRYPRDEDRDLSIAGELGVDVVFAPSVEEMYPAGLPEVTVDPGPLGDRLEGGARSTGRC